MSAVVGTRWLHRGHLFQATPFTFRKAETQQREVTGHGDISTGNEGNMRCRSHFGKDFPNLPT